MEQKIGVSLGDLFSSEQSGQKKKRIMFSAPVFTESGYGVHARQIATWLLEKHRDGRIELFIHPVSWGNTPWIIDSKALGGIIGELQSLSVPAATQTDVSIQLKLPNEWDPKMAPINIGVTAGVETDRANPKWVTSCNLMTHVVVPSNHIKKALEAAGEITCPLTVIPESFPGLFLRETDVEPSIAQKLDTLPTKFNFLVFGQLTGDQKSDRKNTYNTLKWLIESFDGDKNVGIMLKTNMGRNTKIDREITTNTLKQYLTPIKKASSPPVYLFHGSMTDREVKVMYSHDSVKALVSLTRGEGYGLPTLEAAALGLPVIATDWSGHLEFMNTGKFLRINYDLREIHPSRVDNAIFMRGAKWAEPREDDFKKKITKFRSSSEIPKSWAKDISTSIRSKFSPLAINAQYDDVLGKYVI